jgi:2-methylcitrate dehydratase PrpD
MSFECSRRALLNAGALVAGATLLPAARSRAQVVGSVMDALSRYMAAARERPLPPAVIEQTKQHVLDTLAAMVSGTKLLPGQAALRFAATQTHGGAATVVGADFTLDPGTAALVNGTCAQADETDDSHGPSQSHPGAAVVPAALALGESSKIDGTRFLRAVALGYDVGPRLTMALGGVTFRNESRRSTHAFAATFGAAAAAGSAAALDAREMRWLLDYTSQQTAGYAVWNRDTEHIEKSFVFAGMPARAGVTAAELVRAGWTGVDDVFSGDDNFFAVNAPKGDPKVLVDELGARYEVVNTDIKKWSVGTPIQAPLDALELTRKQRPFAAEDVREVVVRLAPTVGAVVDNRDIPDICLQHMVAIMLLDGTASFAAAHDAARMKDAAVLRERAKVRYVPDAQLAALLPARVAVVEVHLRDGTRLSERVEAVRGTVRNPMDSSEIVTKARDLIEPVLGETTAARLITAVFALEQMGDIRSLRPLLQRPSRQ